MEAPAHPVRKDFVRERVMIWLPSPTVCADPEDEAPPTDTAANGVAAEDAAEADGKVAEGGNSTAFTINLLRLETMNRFDCPVVECPC